MGELVTTRMLKGLSNTDNEAFSVLYHVYTTGVVPQVFAVNAPPRTSLLQGLQ